MKHQDERVINQIITMVQQRFPDANYNKGEIKQRISAKLRRNKARDTKKIALLAEIIGARCLMVVLSFSILLIKSKQYREA